MAQALTAGGIDALVRARHQHEPLVICHHRVLPESCWGAEVIPPMLLSPAAFEREIAWLAEHYRFVPLDEIDTAVSTNGHRPAVAITFDDGYRDVYEHAFPILQKHGVPATLFVVTNLVDTDEVPLHDQLFVLLSSLWRREEDPLSVLTGVLRSAGVMPSLPGRHTVLRLLDSLLGRMSQRTVRAVVCELGTRVEVPDEVWRQFRAVTWDMLDEMRRGGFTIGSHTRSHALLPNESDAVVREETRGSRRILEQRLGEPVELFAYPSGRFDARVVRAVHDAGYRLAFGCCTHRNEDHPELTIPRKTLWQNCCLDGRGRFSPALATCQVGRVFDALRRCHQDHELKHRVIDSAGFEPAIALSSAETGTAGQ